MIKSDCIKESFVHGYRELNLYSFALEKPPAQKKHKWPKTKFFRRFDKTVLSHITFYLEDDDHKRVDFNQETKSSTCQLKKLV